MVVIRALELRDVEEVSQIEARSFSMPWSAESFMQLIDDKNSLYLVAEDGHKIKGCCGITNILGEGNINNVVVSSEFRGQGIAKQMLKELLKQSEKIGMEEFTLEVRVSNKVAIHIYEQLGFVSEGIRPEFYDKPKEDAMIMWKRKQY